MRTDVRVVMPDPSVVGEIEIEAAAICLDRTGKMIGRPDVIGIEESNKRDRWRCLVQSAIAGGGDPAVPLPDHFQVERLSETHGTRFVPCRPRGAVIDDDHLDRPAFRDVLRRDRIQGASQDAWLTLKEWYDDRNYLHGEPTSCTTLRAASASPAFARKHFQEQGPRSGRVLLSRGPLTVRPPRTRSAAG